MTFSGDPFRTLGLPPGATDAEIKRAYRALAKRYHPDSAGEAALPRFLAIQAAYDMLTAPDRPPRARAGQAARPGPATGSRSGRAPGGTAGGPGPDRSPGSQADPDRTRATRDAFRTRRTRPSTGPAGGPAWWAAGRNGSAGSAGGAGSAGAAGPTGTAGATGATGQGSAGPGTTAGTGGPQDPGSGARRPAGADPRRRHRTATLGSTSYDDAPREPEPEWDGATWYGDSSGTYWTVNPREYADPRKHGPEYLARARRNIAGGDATGTGPTGATWTWTSDEDSSVDAPDPAADPAPAPRRPADGRPEATPHGGARDGPASGPDLERATRTGPGPSPAPGPARERAPRSGLGSDRDRGAHTAPGPGPGPDRNGAAHTGAAPGPGPDREHAARTGPGYPHGPGPAAQARRERTAAWTATGPSASIAFDPPPPRARDDDDAIERPFNIGIPQRVVLALIAWPPLGFAAGALLSEVTGCGRFSATCEDPAPLLGWLIQPLIVAILLALPLVARPAAVASVAVGIAALGGGVVLSAMGGPRAQLNGVPTLLLAVLVMAYAVGLVGAVSGRVPLPGWLDRSD